MANAIVKVIVSKSVACRDWPRIIVCNQVELQGAERYPQVPSDFPVSLKSVVLKPRTARKLREQEVELRQRTSSKRSVSCSMFALCTATGWE